MMKYVIKCMERGLRAMGYGKHIKSRMSKRQALDLYYLSNHLVKYKLKAHQTRHETLAWKSYYNFLNKRKGLLLGEIEGDLLDCDV